MILLGLGEGHLYFLLCGSTGVTAQTNAINLRDRPHNTQSAAVATWTAEGPRTTFTSTKLSAGNSQLKGDLSGCFPETHSGHIQNRHIQDSLAWKMAVSCFSAGGEAGQEGLV